MRRREVLALLGSVAAAWPMSARPQQPMPIVGFLGVFSSAQATPLVTAVRQGLDEAGYAEDRNVVIEYRWAEKQYDRLPALAADLAARHVAVIAATGGGVAARAAKAATATIPIVFVAGDLDPVASGLVKSLNRPGGNMTGITPATSFLGPKRLELPHDMIPNATAIGILLNPNSADAETQLRETEDAARTLGIRLITLKAGSEAELDTAFASFSQQQTSALLVANDAIFLSRREQLAALAARYAIPAIYPYREYVVAGGLISYAPSLADAYRRAGTYAGKILAGTPPQDLPVEQPMRFELVINLRTAEALGLAVPPSILARADEVIE